MSNSNTKNSLQENIKLMAKDLWKIVEQGIEVIMSEDDNIQYNKENKKIFEGNFIELYEEISFNYMKHSDEPLDRHKVAAIMIISIINAKLLTVQKDTCNIFVGNYVLAADSGLNYMMGEMNRVLKSKGLEGLLSYSFPKAFACKTDYYRIFYRNLYYSDCNKKWNLNPLDISDKLFLVEYLTVLDNKIDPLVLCEFK